MGGGNISRDRNRDRYIGFISFCNEYIIFVIKKYNFKLFVLFVIGKL